MSSASLFDSLAAIVGTDHLLTDEASRTFYGTDVFRQADVLPVAVAQPGTVAELQEIMRLCARHRTPTVVRGGGASYTDGYLPIRQGTLTLDMSRLTHIEISETDLYVTVEPGVTWAKLYEAVSARGLRTPMWGPFSGLAATVAGGMSHYAVNYGSGLYGVSDESLLGMDIILASGEMLSTGSGGGNHSLPFFRHYGPDLTGLFVGDAGAFGVKARMTLRLMQKPTGFAASSFGFPTGENCLTAMMEIARLGVVAQNFGLDPRQQKTALTRMESANPLDAARSVFLSAPNPWDGAVQVMRMGVAGRNFLKNAVYSAHFGTEGLTAAEAKPNWRACARLPPSTGRKWPTRFPCTSMPILSWRSRRSWDPTGSAGSPRTVCCRFLRC
ncbi:MAG: FAD-binding oxidoreductase [Gammaproteobacteria bacterium]